MSNWKVNLRMLNGFLCLRILLPPMPDKKLDIHCANCRRVLVCSKDIIRVRLQRGTRKEVEIHTSSYEPGAVVPVGEPSVHSIATKDMNELGHDGVEIQFKKIVCSCAKPDGRNSSELEPSVIGDTMYNIDQDGPPNTDAKTGRPLVCYFRNQSSSEHGLLWTGDKALLKRIELNRFPPWVSGEELLLVIFCSGESCASTAVLYPICTDRISLG